MPHWGMEVREMEKQVKLIPEKVFQRILKGWTGRYDPAPLYTLAGEPLDWDEIRPVILVGPGVVELRFLHEKGEPEEVRSGVYRAIPLHILVPEERLSEFMEEALPYLIAAAQGAGERWTPEAEEAWKTAEEILSDIDDELTPVVSAENTVWYPGPRDRKNFIRGWGEDHLNLLLQGEVEVVSDWMLDCQKMHGYIVPGGRDAIRRELEKALEILKEGGESER